MPSNTEWTPGARFWAVEYKTMCEWDLHMGGEPAMTEPEQDKATRIAMVRASAEVMAAIVDALNEQAERMEADHAA